MAYATGGTGGNITDLMDAVRAFALSLGWTIDKWDSVNKLLFLHKGICHVTMKGFTDDAVRIYTGAAGANIFTDGNPVHRLFMALNTSNNAALTTYHSHPGSGVSFDKEINSVAVNGLNGPYVAWHLFADPTLSDHVHCVVQINAECYMHFSFGHVDPRGLTHGGVAYVTGVGNTWWRNVNNYLNVAGGQYNQVWSSNIPFCCTNTQSSMQYGSADGAAGVILADSDSWPVSFGGPIADSSGFGNDRHTILRLINANEIVSPADYPKNNAQGAMLQCVAIAEPTPYSNVTPLFTLPVWRHHSDNTIPNSDRICYVGDFPGVRAVNLTNLLPGQILTVDTDDYMIFPALRKSLWSDSNVVDAPCSGPWGIAYKKV